MPLNFGTDTTNQIYRMKLGTTNCRALYFGTSKIWPYYQIEARPNTLVHSGKDNSLKNYGQIIKDDNGALNPNPNPVDENMKPELDPAGGTFSLGIFSKEDSAWHHMSFKLQVPSYVTLTDVREEGATSSLVTTPISFSTGTYTGVQNKAYSTKIYKIDFDPSLNQSNEISNGKLDSGIRLYFTIDQNLDSDYRVGDIVYLGYWDEFNNYVTNQWTITTFRQQPDFIYETRAAWWEGPVQVLGFTSENSSIKAPYNGGTIVSISYDTPSQIIYVLVVFGISQDGGRNWQWGPMNDHKDADGKLNKIWGNPLTNVKNYTTVTITQKSDAYDQPEMFKAEVLDPKIESGYYLLPIKISVEKPNDEHYNDRKEIKYSWYNGSSNTDFGTINGGSKTSGNQSTRRNLEGIARHVITEEREIKISVSFNYERHNFQLG